jgi:hypothetical protein
MNKYLSILLLSIMFGGSACEKATVETIELEYGYEFYPLAIGHTWTYEADSVIYDPIPGGTLIDTIHFFIQETITDTLRDNTGELNYRILYSEKRAGEDWEPVNVYTAQLQKSRALRTEQNFTFIKLVFPISIGDEWEGNAFVDPQTVIRVAEEPIAVFKDWSGHRLLQRLETYPLQGTDYVDVIEVELTNADNGFELRKGKELYAGNIGLIYQELMILNTQCSPAVCGDDPWTSKAEEGFILRKRLLSFQ